MLAAGLSVAMPMLALSQEAAAPAIAPPASDPGVAPGSDASAPPASAAALAADDPAAALEAKRDQVSKELAALSDTLKLSASKAEELRRSIDTLDKSTASLKQALIDSATRRKDIEQKISDGEKKLAEYGVREDAIRKSFRSRRAVLAEVLGALERMGRNPPPALLVKPEDALGAVRTAILLGAVVPGMRKETEKLAQDLQELADLRKAGEKQREDLTASLKGRQEEEARMDLLLAENARLSQENSAQLQDEMRRSEALAQKSTSLEGLISGLESEIASVKAAGEQARLEERKRQQMTEAEREKARQEAEAAAPDKNRIAPAFSLDELKGKLQLPSVGEVMRQFGDADGTGHDAKGMVMATAPAAVVTAPADGTVVYAGQFRSYGKMVILNMGGGYHVILSGMERVTGHAGQFVLSGEPIGVMGERRVASAAAFALETDRPTLYIEFRKDGNSVDSRPWWAKDAGKVRNDS